jgi:hypothetical protein
MKKLIILRIWCGQEYKIVDVASFLVNATTENHQLTLLDFSSFDLSIDISIELQQQLLQRQLQSPRHLTTAASCEDSAVSFRNDLILYQVGRSVQLVETRLT